MDLFFGSYVLCKTIGIVVYGLEMIECVKHPCYAIPDIMIILSVYLAVK